MDYFGSDPLSLEYFGADPFSQEDSASNPFSWKAPTFLPWIILALTPCPPLREHCGFCCSSGLSFLGSFLCVLQREFQNVLGPVLPAKPGLGQLALNPGFVLLPGAVSVQSFHPPNLIKKSHFGPKNLFKPSGLGWACCGAQAGFNLISP